MGLQRVGHDWTTKQQQTVPFYSHFSTWMKISPQLWILTVSALEEWYLAWLWNFIDIKSKNTCCALYFLLHLYNFKNNNWNVYITVHHCVCVCVCVFYICVLEKLLVNLMFRKKIMKVAVVAKLLNFFKHPLSKWAEELDSKTKNLWTTFTTN